MNTICIYPSRDLDGWMSASIVKKWFIENHKESYQITDKNIVKNDDEQLENNKLDMLGWDYGDEIPNLSIYDKAIMCGISFPKEEMGSLYNDGNVDWLAIVKQFGGGHKCAAGFIIEDLNKVFK